MTQFSDRLFIGSVQPYGRSTTSTGAVRQAAFSPGVEQPCQFFYSVVPVTAVSNGLAVNQIVSGAAAAMTLAAGTGVTTTTLADGTTAYAFDVARCLQVQGNQSTVAGVGVTVAGFDDFVQAMTSTFSGPTGSGSPTISPKAFRYVTGVTVSGNTVSGISLGPADYLGFPRYVRSPDEVQISFSGNKVTGAGNITVGDSATATALTGDVRGYYQLTPAANGTRRFTALMNIVDPDTLQGTYGRTQA